MKTDDTNKRETMESFLAEGMVLAQLDSRADGVEVPDHLKGDPMLRLNISGRFGLPLDIDDWGIHATLTFGGDPFECKLPWTAIYIIISQVTGEPCIFPSDVPPEYVSEALGHLKSKGITPPQPQPAVAEEIEEPPRNHLRLVAVEASSEPEPEPKALKPNEEPDPEDDDPSPSPPKKPFLSVVK